MNFFKQMSPLVSAGVAVHLKLSAHDGKMQVDILPVASPGKTGISVPAQALLGTPEELDEGFPDFLTGYVASATNLNEQIAVATAVMEQAVNDAKGAVKEAATKAVKPAPSAAARPSTSKVSGAKPDRTSAGFMDLDEGGGLDDGLPKAGESNGDEGDDTPGISGSTPAAPDTKTQNLFV